MKEVGVTVAGGTRQVLVGNATYLPAGPASSWQFGTTRTLTRTYDQDYRATGVRDPGTGGLDIGYVYDNVSYLKQITTQSTSAVRAKFDYDALGRLLDRKNAADVIQESYTYDGTGNRLSNTVGGTTTTNTYPSTNHRLTQVGAVARTYDNAGNLTAIGGTTREYGYNDANRMSLAKAGGVLQATYLYNGFGEQVQRQTGATTRFVYDEGGSLLGQYDSTGAVVQEYVYLDGIPVGTILSTSQGTGNARMKWVQTDALGTPRAIIDPTRSLAIWRWDENSEAFGNSAPNTDPDADGTNIVFDLRFPGQRYDQASGLYYNYYRDYDPAIGRYTQSDPIGLLGGISTYGYVGGDPVAFKDSMGLFRRQEALSSGHGIASSAAGIAVGMALLATPSPGITQVLGVVVLTKSIWGFAANTYNFARAFSDDGSYDLDGKFTSLARSVAARVAPCSVVGQRVADIVDLVIDFAAGRAVVRSPNLGGYLRTPVGYPYKGNPMIIRTSPYLVSDMMSSGANLYSDVMQVSSSFWYLTDAYGWRFFE